MSKLNEEWRPVVGYEGLYEVSDWGRVKNRFGRMIAQETSKNDYLRVHLWKNGLSYHKSIHRLVAEAFIPNLDNLPQVNHKDEDRTNNNVENLEWCTSSYNINYGDRNKKNSIAQLNDPNKSKPIAVYKYPSMQLIGIFPSTKEVERQLNAYNVTKVAKGIYRQEKGYTFRYV